MATTPKTHDDIEHLKAQHDRVQAFLYLLMRDKLNTGAVESLMDTVRAIRGKKLTFTSKHLAEYADCLAEEILLGVSGGCCDEARFGNGKPVSGDESWKKAVL